MQQLGEIRSTANRDFEQRLLNFRGHVTPDLDHGLSQ